VPTTIFAVLSLWLAFGLQGEPPLTFHPYRFLRIILGSSSADGKAAFSAISSLYIPGNMDRTGVYVQGNDSIRLVADTTTPIPGGTGTFGFFGASIGRFGVEDGRVAFEAGDNVTAQQGIYLFDGSSLSRVADKNTAIPNGSGKFLTFANPDMRNGEIVFAATGAGGQSGIYLADGPNLTVIADTHTLTPGGGNFTALASPSISGSAVVS
jgi:hypothetical protein